MPTLAIDTTSFVQDGASKNVYVTGQGQDAYGVSCSLLIDGLLVQVFTDPPLPVVPVSGNWSVTLLGIPNGTTYGVRATDTGGGGPVTEPVPYP
jgi:hypothetical protein